MRPAGRSEGRENEEVVIVSVQVRGQVLGVTERDTEGLRDLRCTDSTGC